MLADFLRKGKPGNAKTYVEDVFSAYTYTGNGSTQTINNGIDLAGKGGLLWLKKRTGGVNPTDHLLIDTIRGYNHELRSDLTNAETTSGYLSGFTSNGFTLGLNSDTSNYSAATYASWTFRKAPKFFDMVTYTGDGAGDRAIPHSLGIAPGLVIVKATSTTGDWKVYHRSFSSPGYMLLNTTGAFVSSGAPNPVYGDASNLWVHNYGAPWTENVAGVTYVAYLFAHDTSADGLIQCGSYTGNGSTSGPSVSLGWEPQWVLIKSSSVNATGWEMYDSVRGVSTGGVDQLLEANTNGSEITTSINYIDFNATGFTPATSNGSLNGNGGTYIYVAIRRGPMKTPTTGTQVLIQGTWTGTGSSTNFGLGIPVDMALWLDRNSSSYSSCAVFDRLRGNNRLLHTVTTSAEISPTDEFSLAGGASPTTGSLGASATYTACNASSNPYGYYFFRRYPGVFDIVCFTGTGAANQRVSHSLGVVPEMLIVKSRAGSGTSWEVYHSSQPSNQCGLNTTSAFSSGTSTGHNIWGTSPASHTSNDFGIDTWWTGLSVTDTHVAYLFATLSGISKVGSYTGNGTSQTINCGFSAGARFALIKRTDSTGDWYVWDSVRGIVAANDPHLSLNTTAAEVTTDDSIDPDPSGFIVNQNTATNINVNAAAYIYLAFA